MCLKKQKINFHLLINFNEKELFNSKIYIRQIDNIKVIKQIDFIEEISGKITKILCIKNILIFDFKPNYSYNTKENNKGITNNQNN